MRYQQIPSKIRLRPFTTTFILQLAGLRKKYGKQLKFSQGFEKHFRTKCTLYIFHHFIKAVSNTLVKQSTTSMTSRTTQSTSRWCWSRPTTSAGPPTSPLPTNKNWEPVTKKSPYRLKNEEIQTSYSLLYTFQFQVKKRWHTTKQ